MVPEKSLLTITGRGAGIHGIWHEQRAGLWPDGKAAGSGAVAYLRSDSSDPAVFAWTVYVLHGMPRRTGADEAASALLDPILSNGFRRWRCGRTAGGSA